jgi:hypothetical protein
VEHLAYEFNARRLVRIGFFEMHDKSKCAVFKWSIGGPDDDGVPTIA